MTCPDEASVSFKPECGTQASSAPPPPPQHHHCTKQFQTHSPTLQTRSPVCPPVASVCSASGAGTSTTSSCTVAGPLLRRESWTWVSWERSLCLTALPPRHTLLQNQPLALPSISGQAGAQPTDTRVIPETAFLAGKTSS